MIRYNKRICVKQTRQGEWVIDSDRGQRFETLQVHDALTPITRWWDSQHHSDLREWQKDVLIKQFSDVLGQLDLFIVFQRGHGYNQPHDLVVAKRDDIWIVSTQEDTWITKNNQSEFWLTKDDSLGSVMERSTREELWKISDGLKGLA